MKEAIFDKDRDTTLENREKLFKNKNLLFWYRKLYDLTIGAIPGHREKKILEIGSGTSPLKIYYPWVITSDILPLDYLNHTFDCQQIDAFVDIEDGSLDCISLTNVLHHLPAPLDFLVKAQRKLKTGGTIILTEPYLSLLSKPIYRYVHYERTDTRIDRPLLDESQGPLSSSNQAIPYLIFFRKKEWFATLESTYQIDTIRYFTSLAYFLTGGIRHRLPLPGFIYRLIFTADAALARLSPRLFASFFTITLRKKQKSK
ncbi:MAG: methyltransferase domain-containing protein [Bacteroidales bacterium]|nr:methyltransferase domain-containing protein [Bacteroidales bacterium]